MKTFIIWMVHNDGPVIGTVDAEDIETAIEKSQLPVYYAGTDKEMGRTVLTDGSVQIGDNQIAELTPEVLRSWGEEIAKYIVDFGDAVQLASFGPVFMAAPEKG